MSTLHDDKVSGKLVSITLMNVSVHGDVSLTLFLQGLLKASANGNARFLTLNTQMP